MKCYETEQRIECALTVRGCEDGWRLAETPQLGLSGLDQVRQHQVGVGVGEMLSGRTKGQGRKLLGLWSLRGSVQRKKRVNAGFRGDEVSRQVGEEHGTEFVKKPQMVQKHLKPVRCVINSFFLIFKNFYSVTIVCIFSPSLHPTPAHPPPSPTSTLPLDFVHVSFIVTPVDSSPHSPLPTPLWLLLHCS